MIASFEDALLKALHDIADKIEDVSFALEELTQTQGEIADRLRAKEEPRE